MSKQATAARGRRYAEKSASERRAERRARLFETALEAFGTRGYAVTSIEQLCAEAAISTRTFYEEFGGREELLIALHDDVNARALEAVGKAIAVEDPNDLAGRAKAGVSAYFEVMTADRRFAQIALVESVGVSPRAEAARREAIDRFGDLIHLEADRLAEAGIVAKRDYTLTAIALVGAILGLVNTWTAEEDWASRVDQVVAEATRLIVVALSSPG